MEIAFNILNFILIAAILGSPIFFFYFLEPSRSWRKFALVLGLSLFTIVSVAAVFAWWTDFSTRMLIEYYGYNLDGLSAQERFKGVELLDRDKVDQLLIGYFGIGWPAKLIMMLPLLAAYPFIVAFFWYTSYLIKNTMNKKNI